MRAPASPRDGRVRGHRCSMEQLGRGESEARQSNRGSDEPLQECRLERRDVVLGCEMKKPSFNVGHAFADIGRHLFHLGEARVK